MSNWHTFTLILVTRSIAYWNEFVETSQNGMFNILPHFGNLQIKVCDVIYKLTLKKTELWHQGLWPYGQNPEESLMSKAVGAQEKSIATKFSINVSNLN
ncbi:unnamed protein product [Rhizophagus irregularis]|nr:unnamed protein product [Rhizophagus irregularis]